MLLFQILWAQNWNEIVKNSASNRASSENLGCSVAISGDYAIVGVYGEAEYDC